MFLQLKKHLKGNHYDSDEEVVARTRTRKSSEKEKKIKEAEAEEDETLYNAGQNEGKRIGKVKIDIDRILKNFRFLTFIESVLSKRFSMT